MGTSPLSEVRYLKRKNLENEALLQKGYFREIIYHYGMDVEYYRLALDYYATPSGLMANYVYGESPTSTYEVSADLVAFVSIEQDNPMLKQFGIESSVNSELYVMRQDFEESLRDKVGLPTTGIFTSTIYGDIADFSGLLTGTVVGGELSGVTSATTVVPSGSISGTFSSVFTRYPVAVNPTIVRPMFFTDRTVNGTMAGTVSGTIDASGNGIISGTASGVLTYFSSAQCVSGKTVWGIAPQVGDFIRLKEFDSDVNNYEEYEVTQVNDKDLSPHGLNPHVKRYLWRCGIVRRDPSNEIVSASSIQKEAFSPVMTEWNTVQEVRSNMIFDYATTAPGGGDPDTGADGVYGSY